MKRILALLLAVVICASMVGCGDKAEDVSASAQTTFTGQLEGALKDYTFKVGTSGTYAPFSYFDADGKTLIGFDMDFMKELQDLLGFKLDGSVQAMDYSPLTTSVAEGKLDFAMAALCATDTRKKVMNFTTTYYNAGLTVIVNKDISPKEINGWDSIKDGKYKIAVQKGDASHLYATNNGIPNSSLEVHDSIITAYEALEQGKVDCMIFDAPGTAYYITHKEGSKLEMVGEQFSKDQSPYAIALSFDICKKNPQLLSIFNAAIDKLTKDGKMAEIEKKWCK